MRTTISATLFWTMAMSCALALPHLARPVAVSAQSAASARIQARVLDASEAWRAQELLNRLINEAHRADPPSEHLSHAAAPTRAAASTGAYGPARAPRSDEEDPVCTIAVERDGAAVVWMTRRAGRGTPLVTVAHLGG